MHIVFGGEQILCKMLFCFFLQILRYKTYLRTILEMCIKQSLGLKLHMYTESQQKFLVLCFYRGCKT